MIIINIISTVSREVEINLAQLGILLRTLLLETQVVISRQVQQKFNMAVSWNGTWGSWKFTDGKTTSGTEWLHCIELTLDWNLLFFS